MKALLLRVGIDKGSGGTYGPIFKDGSFEFIPIPETYRSCTATTYGERIGRKGKPLSAYVQPALRHVPMHDDPEFETCTYGDPSLKRRYLLELSKEDLLVFYAGLKPFNHDNPEYPEALYFVGYFTIGQVIDFNWLSASERAAYRQRYPYNAHIKRGYAFENLVIAVGSKDSRLLNRALLVSEKRPDKSARPTFALSSKMEDMLGISGFIQRSIPPRFVTQERSTTQLVQLLHSS
ncbi:MAG: Nmad3 family putative nucleotide modification protein [Halobacteriota archaeon]